MSAKKQLAAVTKAADELEMQLRRMASLVGELQEAEVARRFEDVRAMLNLDGKATIYLLEGFDGGRHQRFDSLIQELIADDSVLAPDEQVKVVRFWRAELARSVQQLDDWLVVNGGEAKR